MRAAFMRAIVFGGILGAGILTPRQGLAQAPATEYPSWLFSGEPIVVAGLVHVPTGQTRFFDSQTMQQIEMYLNVPVYWDPTRDPNPVVYVPIGRGLVRAYERRPGLPASNYRAPVFAVEPTPAVVEQLFVATGLAGSPATGAATGATGSLIPTPTHMESVARPSGPNGVWVEFNGSRWYSDGRAVAYSADRFVKIGDYHEFPVYREPTGTSETIWVSVAKDGPLAPYAKR